ncbi:MAG: AraC family transcriptional regulator [Clostridia bacterium]
MYDMSKIEELCDNRFSNLEFELPKIPSIINIPKICCHFNKKDFFIEKETIANSLTVHLQFSGTTFLSFSDKEYIIEKGDIFILPGYNKFVYHNINNSNLGYLWLNLDTSNSMEIIKYLKATNKDILRSFENEKVVEKLVKTFEYIKENGYDNIFDISALAHELILSIVEVASKFRTNSYSSIIKEALKYISKNIENDITVTKICEELNISSSALLKNFKKQFDISPMQFIKREKIKYSVELLKNTNYTCQEIAEKICYYDSAHFTNNFVDIIGVTPIKFRKRHRSEIKTENQIKEHMV